MANDKFYGYSPDASKEAEGNRLDRLNPYEFRKGMDYELTSLGCSRLAESTVEEREKATETVLKNIQEHNGYYTSLITYETLHRNLEDKPTFKKWLAEQGESQMKEVDEKYTNDKMVELKETIKARVRKLMKEYANPEDEMMDMDDEDERDGWMGADDAKDMHTDLGVNEEEEEEQKSAVKGAKGKAKQLKALEKETENLGKERLKNVEKLSAPLAKYKDGKMSADEYREATKELVDRNKEIVDRVKEIEKEKEAISLDEKMGRREVAKTMMEKETHLEILEIIKEAGINLREGADGIKVYYEIAKTAYQEGFMAGLHKN
jgi:hypothetical protein